MLSSTLITELYRRSANKNITSISIFHVKLFISLFSKSFYKYVSSIMLDGVVLENAFYVQNCNNRIISYYNMEQRRILKHIIIKLLIIVPNILNSLLCGPHIKIHQFYLLI